MNFMQQKQPKENVNSFDAGAIQPQGKWLGVAHQDMQCLISLSK